VQSVILLKAQKVHFQAFSIFDTVCKQQFFVQRHIICGWKLCSRREFYLWSLGSEIKLPENIGND